MNFTSNHFFAVAASAAAVIASTATATFTGIHTEHYGVMGGRHIWRVYATSNTASDVLLNIFDHRVTGGSMAGVQHHDAGGGTWQPNAIFDPDYFNDSFVTITGRLDTMAMGTSLDPSWGPSAGSIGDIPLDAGWFTNNPGTDIRADSGHFVNGHWRIMIMQIAGATLVPGSPLAGYSATASIGWKVGGTGSPSFTLNQGYTIPAPAPLALLAFAAMSSRRRRTQTSVHSMTHSG